MTSEDKIDSTLIDGFDRAKIMEILSKDRLVKIILYLLAFPELSLVELTNLIERSKATLHRDLKELIDLNIVNEVRQDPSTKSKFYTINPKFIFGGLQKLTKPEQLQTMDSTELKEVFDLLIQTTQSTVVLLKQSLEYLEKYFDWFTEMKKNSTLTDAEAFHQWLNELQVGLRIIPLSEKAYPIYTKLVTEFNQKLNKELEKIEGEESHIGGEYLVWHILLPLKKILK